jgi:hypothetical protein
MRTVDLSAVADGDILARDLYVNNVYLFGAGTVLTRQRIAILSELKVTAIAIEERHQQKHTLKEQFDILDKRFSYAGDNPLMLHLRAWIKDILSNTQAGVQ